MALVDDILGFFRTNYTPAPGQFLRFDQQRLCDGLRLRDLGRERGAKDQPPADATDLDVVELNIAEGMRQQALIDEARTREELDHYAERLKAANPAGESAAMLMEAQTAVAGFRKEMLEARAILDQARKSVIERERRLSEFRAEHRLKRPPNPPRAHWIMSLVLVVCLLGEIAMNSSILSAGSEFGILGGIVSASIYTLLSMSLSFILGIFCLTRLVHIGWGWKLLGLVSSLFVFGAIVFFNLLAAHYRIAIASGVPELEATRVAMRTLLATPDFFLTDTQSVLMVGLSLVVAFVTMMEGLYWLDSYPGYARVHKYQLQAHARWVNHLRDHGTELEGIYNDSITAIRDQQLKLSNRQMMIPQIIGNRRRLINNFNTHLQHIQDVGRFLISNYREANSETRKKPRPKYFNRAWKLDTVSPIEPPLDHDAGHPSTWQDVGDKLLAASKELNDAHEEAVAWIRQLSSAESAAHADARQAQDQAKAVEETEVKSGRPTLTVVGDGA